MQTFENLSKEAKVAAAIKLVVLDAIGKGKTDPKQLAAYMDSKTFDKAVQGYMDLFNNYGYLINNK